METYENIKLLREKLGLSQEELAERVGYKDNQEKDGKHCHCAEKCQKELADDSRYVSLRVNHILDKRGYRKNARQAYR